MAGAIVIGIILGLGLYLFACFVSFKICEKFGIGSLFECCIPIYNYVLLCRCADISGWNVLWVILPSLVFRDKLAAVATIITLIFSVVLWGRIAQRMERGFWQYGLGCTFLLGIPILVLAFGSAQPTQGRLLCPSRNRNDLLLQEPIYKPLPANNGLDGVIAPLSSVEIFCISGEFKGNTIPVPPEGLTIGRDPAQCQVVLSSNDASRRHASVVSDRNSSHCAVVTDLQSTNGTFRQVSGSSPNSVRWERIVGGSVLKQGSRFRVGKDVVEFEVR